MGTNIDSALFKFSSPDDQIRRILDKELYLLWNQFQPVLFERGGALSPPQMPLFMNITTFIIIIIDVVLSPQKLGPIILWYSDNLVQRQIIKAENPLKARYFHALIRNSGRMVFLIMGPRTSYEAQYNYVFCRHKRWNNCNSEKRPHSSLDLRAVSYMWKGIIECILLLRQLKSSF